VKVPLKGIEWADPMSPIETHFAEEDCMVNFQKAERRRHLRSKEAIFCPISFEYEGMRVQAFVRDVSAGGAQFTACEMVNFVKLDPTNEIEYTINTYHGSITCRALTRWEHWIEGDYTRGVEFTQLPEGSDTILRQAIDCSNAPHGV
jgi:hypothetical protein